MSSTTSNLYVAFIENKRKDNLIHIYYLQYNGNEEELTKFYNYVHQAAEAGYELYGDASSFDMILDTLIPEEAVDLHTRLNSNEYVKFTKVDGKFKCPISEQDIDGTNSNDLALILDEQLYRGQIQFCFKKEKNTN